MKRGFFYKTIKVDNSMKIYDNSEVIQKTKILPKHLAVIMDGNRRWAKKHNLAIFMGHREGVKTIKMIITESIKAGIKILTLYAFSTENWKRTQKEINSLMNLFGEVIEKEKKNLIENQIKVNFIGNRKSLSKSLKLAMGSLEKATEKNSGLILNIAINYGGRAEICHAFQSIFLEIKENNIEFLDIDETIVNQHLFTSGIPDPDLLIRTGGEKRISNFLLWQIAYSELWFTKTFWPDFSENDFWKALNDYEKRVRKFGGEI
jgi:undecaprenyl diphosphate synthase